MNIFGKRSDLPVSHKKNKKKDENMVSFTHEQNIICSQTQVDDIAHEQTIINFEGSYLQVTGWAFGQLKGRTICIE